MLTNTDLEKYQKAIAGILAKQSELSPEEQQAFAALVELFNSGNFAAAENVSYLNILKNGMARHASNRLLQLHLKNFVEMCNKSFNVTGGSTQTTTTAMPAEKPKNNNKTLIIIAICVSALWFGWKNWDSDVKPFLVDLGVINETVSVATPDKPALQPDGHKPEPEPITIATSSYASSRNTQTGNKAPSGVYLSDSQNGMKYSFFDDYAQMILDGQNFGGTSYNVKIHGKSVTLLIQNTYPIASFEYDKDKDELTQISNDFWIMGNGDIFNKTGRNEKTQATVPSEYPDPTVKNASSPNHSVTSVEIVTQRLLTENDLQGLSKVQLRIMRNEIYARHGYKFKSADLRAYFSAKDWYNPQYNDVSHLLNTIEKKNVEFIKKRE